MYHAWNVINKPLCNNSYLQYVGDEYNVTLKDISNQFRYILFKVRIKREMLRSIKIEPFLFIPTLFFYFFVLILNQIIKKV